MFCLLFILFGMAIRLCNWIHKCPTLHLSFILFFFYYFLFVLRSSCQVTQAAFKRILLTLPPGCWDYWCVPPHTAILLIYNIHKKATIWLGMSYAQPCPYIWKQTNKQTNEKECSLVISLSKAQCVPWRYKDDRGSLSSVWQRAPICNI
jgi:hypothetical protein